MRKVFTLFLAIFITALSSVNISAQTCGTATRTAQDCKAGTVDAVGWAMQQFFNDGSTAGWNFEPGAVFQENADGTANLTGIITQYGSSPKRSFNVVVNFTGKSKLTTGTPETNNLCPVIATSAWQYYTLSSGSLTGVSGTMCEGAKLTLSQHMMPSQYGIGAANQCSEQTNLGLTGWFEYQIISQPSNGRLLINSYPGNPVIGQADICIRLSGTPTSCGGGSSPPVANPDVASTPQNTPVTIASLGNDILNGGTGAVLTLVSNPSYGTVQIVNGRFVYTPNPGFSGTDVFTYKIVASNGTSNTTTVSVTVTKTVNLCDNDIIPPVFANCPSNISLTTTSYCAIASWTAPTATDNCSIPTVIQTAGGSNGSCFSVGTTIVTYTATDAKGNKATCSFTVTVINNCPQPPTPYGFTFIGRYGNNFYYRLNGGEESYYKGKEDAKKAGGYLACPKESKEKEYVRGICGTNNYWLDMEREGSSDKWKCTDGSYASYYNWSNDDNRNYDYSKKHAKGYNDGYYRSCKDEEYGSVIIVIPCGGIPVPICTQPTTPSGYTYIGLYGSNYYYRLNGGEESYYKGKEDAKKAGGYLACPKESKEKEYVRGICGTNNYWLDMEREGSSDKWKCTDGSYASYYNWSNDDNRNYDYSKKHAKGYNDGYYRSCKDEEYGSVIIVIPCGGIPVPICTQPTTPSGYTYIGLYGSNYYYRLNGGEESYYKGKEDAKKAGGYLACPKESKEKEYVRGICGTNNYWLDMEREGSSDKWKCTDGSYASYYNWSNDDNRNYDYSKKHAKVYNDGYYRSCKDEEYGSVIIVIPCGGIPLPPVPVCNANFDQNKYYKIVNKKSGKCLDVEGGRKDKYAAVEQYDYFGGDNQKWYIIPTSDGYCKMYAKHSDKILSCSYSWNGSQLYQDEDKKDNDKDNSHGEKEWKIECDKDGYKITHRMSGRSCHEGNGIYNGSHCQLWDWNSGDEERYDLVDVTNDQQQGQHFQNTKVLSISATVEANKTRLEWLNNTGATNDFFQVEKLNATTGNFEAIANVPSLKTTVMESYVSFDVKPTEGDNFYRINAISLDGSNNISNVQKVNFKGLAGNISVFPNPADEVLNIDLTNYKGKAVTLFVYNRLGQTVITQQIENVVDGITQVDISNQQVGNYLVRVVSKGKNDQTKSFILNK